MRMKTYFPVVMIFLTILGFAFPSFSGRGKLLTEITAYGDGEQADIRVVDEADLFTSKEREELEGRLRTAREETGMDLAVLTIRDAGEKSAREYADAYYDEQELGFGSAHSGVLYLIDMDHREIALSALGEMSRYLTDDRVEQILDQAIEDVKAQRYADSARDVLDGICGYVRSGIDPEQRAVRSVTGHEALLALTAAGILAALTCLSTANQYRMKAGRRQALNSYLAYCADSRLVFRESSDVFIDSVLTQRTLHRNTGNPGGGASGGGAGRTTVHRSGSSRTHSGSSRKF